jgi:hypothetical protein
MAETSVELLAARLARLYVKNTSGETQKWEKMTADQRSLWRLIARAAMETDQNGEGRPPQRQAGSAGRMPSEPISFSQTNR